MSLCKQLVLLCRPGFEKECAGEIIDIANTAGFPAYIQTNDNTGIVLLIGTSGQDARELFELASFDELIFARQWFAALPELDDLPEHNRIPPLISAIKKLGLDFSDIHLNHADTNEGKSLSRFCNQFRPHLLNAAKKEKLLSAHASQQLHIMFLTSQHVYVGTSPVENSAHSPMGIPRLRMPSSAPSRSTLKLEEAIHWFVPDEKQHFKAGMSAVDLGAAPGGWTWQLTKRGLLVTAIDNGPMDERLMQSGMVEHYRTDAFTFQPGKPVDWLVCDMVERPHLVTQLVINWLKHRQCKNAIFNLKLPMKKRLQTVLECKTLVELELAKANIGCTVRMKQLYHDREEITACIMPTINTM
jgi:23S rRNA (cytidine2498-2'-O)-methyltransferase